MNKYQTVGDLRAAAFELCERLRGTPHILFAAELHDSICGFLPCDSSITVEEVLTALDVGLPS